MSDPTTTNTKLTNQELRVLVHANRGLSSKQIGEAMFISKRTVDFHKANVYSKLKVKNIVSAINTAKDQGYSLKG